MKRRRKVRYDVMQHGPVHLLYCGRKRGWVPADEASGSMATFCLCRTFAWAMRVARQLCAQGGTKIEITQFYRKHGKRMFREFYFAGDTT